MITKPITALELHSNDSVFDNRNYNGSETRHAKLLVIQNHSVNYFQSNPFPF